SFRRIEEEILARSCQFKEEIVREPGIHGTRRVPSTRRRDSGSSGYPATRYNCRGAIRLREIKDHRQLSGAFHRISLVPHCSLPRGAGPERPPAGPCALGTALREIAWLPERSRR